MDGTARVAVCAVLSFASLHASAAEQGFYFGALGGRGDYDFEATPPLVTTSTPLPPGVVDSVTLGVRWQPTEDHRGTAWGVVGGYRIMRYAAVELNYLELGELESSGTANVRVAWPPPARTVTGQYRRELHAQGGSISALGILPIADMLSIYARGGMLFADTQLKSTVVGSSGGISAGSNTLLWGGGAQLDFGAHWSIRADFQRVNDIGDKLHTARADVDLLSLGVVFRL